MAINIKQKCNCRTEEHHLGDTVQCKFFDHPKEITYPADQTPIWLPLTEERVREIVREELDARL